MPEMPNPDPSHADSHPAEPATVSLTVACEGHDAALVQAALTRLATDLRADWGTNVGPITVHATTHPQPPAGLPA